LQDVKVDIAVYKKKRDLLCDGLAELDYRFERPLGAFYLFPESPIPNDVEFVQILLEKNILVVPGSAFGSPGYFRIAYCVDDTTIINSLAGFAEAIKDSR
jgi:aspartate aminotransferase